MHACYAYPNSLSLNGQVQEHSKHVACVFRVIYSFLHAVSHQAEALATLSMHHVLFPALLCHPFALQCVWPYVAPQNVLLAAAIPSLLDADLKLCSSSLQHFCLQ